MNSILFVDDEPAITQGLKRMLRPMRHEWDMHFTLSAKEALTFMKTHTVDVLISDMRMPEMNGAELLSQVMHKYPQVIRIILSGQSDQEAILKTIKPAHQFLTKPCDAETLKHTIKKTLCLKNSLENPALQNLISQIETLPSLPSCYQNIMSVLQKETGSLKEVSDIIQQDVAMTMEILKYVNSSFFGLYRKVSNIQQAVALLGINIIKTLVLSIHVFSQFEAGKQYPIHIKELWEHSFLTAMFTKKIMADLGAGHELQDDAFTLGLLHDIGMLTLAIQTPEIYQKVYQTALQNKLTIPNAEYQVLGTSHAEVGAYLIGLWGVSSDLITSISAHHLLKTTSDDLDDFLIALHTADIFAQQFMQKNQGLPLEAFQPAILNNAKFTDNLERWETLCGEIYDGAENE